MHPAAKAEVAKKAQLAERLQELCRSLQAQNRAAREEDAAKRKQLLDGFQASIEDIKSKCALCAATCFRIPLAWPAAGRLPTLHMQEGRAPLTGAHNLEGHTYNVWCSIRKLPKCACDGFLGFPVL